ncbi:acetate--CoA ligase family protein [Actinomadura physcomitrii]|uniref:acetate--CoA ligase family protein n=1 Tax=Actinomadura physcomitrii TaxID=2650748 RepID=UPI00136C9AEF|nr:acetate--CoA ligase family protein [Actinomadura physcomitrii]
MLPDYGYLSSPFDVIAAGWGDGEVCRTAATALAACPTVDLVAFTGDAPTAGPNLQEAGWPAMIAGLGAASSGDVPVAVITSTTDTDPELPGLCERHGVTLLAGMRPALRAIRHAGLRLERLKSLTEDPAGPLRASELADVGQELLDGEPETVPETAAKALLGHYGITVPEGGSASDEDAAVAIAERIGYPVVCKLEADGLAHKSDIGGVVVGIHDADQLRGAVRDVLDRGRTALGPAPVRGVRVETAAETDHGVELIVGGSNDGLASVVVLGAGGVLTELLNDAVTLLWPFTQQEVLQALQGLRVGALLRGYRGAPACDLASVAQATVAVGCMLADLPQITELDVNPLLCTPKGTTALDTLIRQRRGTAPTAPDRAERF